MNKTDLSSATEEQLLLQRLREGDMGSYETLFHRYYPTFFAFAKGMLKDAGAAEDIIQNVFMKIWIHREALDETMSIKTIFMYSPNVKSLIIFGPNTILM